MTIELATLTATDIVAVLAGGGAVAGALRVVLARRSFGAVLGLLLTIVCLSLEYLTLAAPVIAFVQILVYAGAVVVLFLFVVMLLDLGRAGAEAPGRGPVGWVWAVGLTGALFALATLPLALAGAWPRSPGVVPAAPADVGTVLFTRYLVSFEAAAVYLLAAVVGAVYVAHHREAGERSRPGAGEPPAAAAASPPPLVEAGKEA